jgi:hypothetical protein
MAAGFGCPGDGAAAGLPPGVAVGAVGLGTGLGREAGAVWPIAVDDRSSKANTQGGLTRIAGS